MILGTRAGFKCKSFWYQIEFGNVFHPSASIAAITNVPGTQESITNAATPPFLEPLQPHKRKRWIVERVASARLPANFSAPSVTLRLIMGHILHPPFLASN
jgi:hypothetical protein